MATVPLSASSIRFISGVPFLNDYHHVRHFETEADQIAYFNGKYNVHSMTQTSIVTGEKGSYIKANVSIDKLYKSNYVVFLNPDFGNKYFYAFITHLEYANIGMTRVYIEVDVMQTWMFDYQIKPSYIERQHCTLRDTAGNPIINTIPEQLDFGSEYDIVTEDVQYPSLFLYLIIVTSKAIGAGATTINDKPGYVGSPTPLFYYVFPIKRSSKKIPSTIGGVDTLNLEELNLLLSTNTDIVNATQAMYITDWCGIQFNETQILDDNVPVPSCCSLEYIPYPLQEVVVNKAILHVTKEIQYFDGKELIFTDKFAGLPNFFETKLYMYPYTVYEMDDLKGNRLTFRGEYINGDDIYLTVRGAVGFANRMSYELKNYNGSAGRQSSYQQAVIDINPNDIPIVSSYLAAYLQGNKNSIQAQKTNAEVRGSANMLGSFVTGAVLAGSGSPVGIATGVATATSGIIDRHVDIQTTENTLLATAQDATNVPPSVAKMGGNTAYDYGNGLNGIRIIKKTIKPEYRDILAHYWNKYGYKYHKVDHPNRHTRRYWNYLKTVNITIIGDINNDDLRTIKNIYDSGVTLWHTNDIGNYQLTNEVIA